MADAPPKSLEAFPWRRSLITGILFGAGYGVLLRVLITWHNLTPDQAQAGAVLTIAFLLFGSIFTGFLTIQVAERTAPRSVAEWVFAPWLAVIFSALILWIFLIEGLICIVMALPIMFLCASLGGIIAGLLARHGRRLSTTTLSSLALLPVLLAPAESLHLAPTQTRTVSSQILIHAPAPVVWQNIARVPAIAPAELRPSWAHLIGFPRPVEATLSFPGIGGVRHATFEHGLTFIETVNGWQPEDRLSFSIRADTADIPPTTLDEHVTIGGPYFDVLDGEYRLQPLPNGDILLHLTSHERLSTDLNGYAGLWTDAVMQNLQTSILQVIQHRCEQQARLVFPTNQ